MVKIIFTVGAKPRLYSLRPVLVMIAAGVFAFPEPLSHGGGMGGFMTGRAAADLLTRTTTVLGACFMASSLTLAILASNERQPSSILDQPRPVPLAPTQPGEPSVPLAR